VSIAGSKTRSAIVQPLSVMGGSPLIAPPITRASSSFSDVTSSSVPRPRITRIIEAAGLAALM